MTRNLLVCFVALAASLPVAPVEAATGPGGYSMEVLVGGWQTPEYAARGTRYVEAQAGREYTIRLSNPTNRRVGVALSVDGLNSIDAKRTSAEEATKWVIEPHGVVEIRGWQTSEHSNRAFFFTTEQRSYGAWLGQTDNLGVISAAFFPEVAIEHSYWYSAPPQPGANRDDSRYLESEVAASGAAPAKESRKASAGSAQEDAAEGMAATGIGRERRNQVTEVDLLLEERAAAVLSVRYEYHDELVRLGVLPRPSNGLQRREGATGFEASSFAPDPYRPGW